MSLQPIHCGSQLNIYHIGYSTCIPDTLLEFISPFVVELWQKLNCFTLMKTLSTPLKYYQSIYVILSLQCINYGHN
jgi:hypothetical protein